jgi:hypothetical protein
LLRHAPTSVRSRKFGTGNIALRIAGVNPTDHGLAFVREPSESCRHEAGGGNDMTQIDETIASYLTALKIEGKTP